ncbi:uncharacterized protein LOC129592855 isoform X2 [Paramacrobiotus metropolitanus]|nr:uncharacterized protein LOC129592855 isoform X2 [Paramacrobiotus metropolitanus]
MTVEVLVRLDHDQPLRWWPAVLLGFDNGRGTFGFASIIQPSSTINVVVPAHRIRTHCSEWVAVTQEDCRKLEEESHKEPLVPTTAPAVRTFKSPEAQQQHPIGGKDDGGRPAKRLRYDRDDAEKSDIHLLPAIILAEIFECLDTPVRCRYRNVCSYWNDVLTMPRIRSQLRLNYAGRVNSAEEVKQGFPEEEYLNAVCASECWAQTIVITGPPGYIKPMFSSVSVVIFSVEAFGLCPPRTLLVSDWHCHIGYVSTNIKELTSLCQVLVLRNVYIAVPFTRSRNIGECISMKVFKVRITNGRVVPRLDWWHTIENCLPALTEIELARVLDWLAETHQDDDGRVEWEDVKQDLLKWRKEVQDSDIWRSTSESSRKLHNPTAEDLVRWEVQRLPKILQHDLRAQSISSERLEVAISW